MDAVMEFLRETPTGILVRIGVVLFLVAFFSVSQPPHSSGAVAPQLHTLNSGLCHSSTSRST